MKKYVFILCISALLYGCKCLKTSNIRNKHTAFSVAHRGCTIDGFIPENSLAAVAYAHRYGYRAVECDPKYTADSVLVLLHDQSINRCLHYTSGYAPVIEKTFIEDLSFKELRENYVLNSSDPSQRVPVPTLHEFLQTCRKYRILPMVHSDVYEILQKANEETKGNFIAFGTNYDALKHIREISDCLILWDPGQLSAEETVYRLQKIGGCCGVSSMNSKLLTADYIRTVHEAGFLVQSSIFPAPCEMQCITDGADILLSDFHLTAAKNTKTWKTEKTGRKTLQKGECLHYSFDSTECGSMEIQLVFQGEIEIVINNTHTYHIQNPSNSSIIYKNGWRFYRQSVDIRITACKNTKIRTLKLKVYKY